MLLGLIEQGAQKSVLELLKEDNDDISEDELNKSLISACRHGYMFIVQMLVRIGANVNYIDTNGNTPLLVSVQNGAMDIVQFLLANKADVNASNSVGDSALILSTHSSGSTYITDILLRQPRINIDYQNQDGYTAIMKAAEVKNIDTLKILLEKYFNIDCISTSAVLGIPIDETETLEHTSNNDSHYVLQWTTLVKIVNNNGENVYRIAQRCEIESVLQLLQQHVVTKISPLELAMRAVDLKSFHIFLDCDFLYVQDREPLDEVFSQIFQTCSNKDIIHFNESEITMIKALLEHGADVNKTWLYCTPMLNGEQVDSYRFERSYPTNVSQLRQLHCEKQIDPIIIATKSGCVKVLELLLTFGADVNRYDFQNSPLHIALSQGHTECAKFLIQRAPNIDFEQALKLAVDQQEPKHVRLLIESDKNKVMKHLGTSEIQDILLRSVRMSNLEIIGQILDLGGDINSPIDCVTYPLAVSKNGEVAKFLIDRGANVNHINTGRYIISTPLNEIVYDRDIYDNSVLEVIQVLLENGASVNDRHWSGKTALMLAAGKEGSRRALRLLLDYGAELSERDREGNTALIYATQKGCSQNVSFLLQFMQDKKYILNLQNNEGLTAVMCAVRLRNSFVIKELTNQGADLNIKDRNGNTALLHLLLASNKHEDEILRSLIQAGCDVNCQNNEGISPLMLAAKRYLKDTMCVLLDSGADINAISKKDNSKTALTHLLYRSYRDYDYFSCLEYLLSRGASSSHVEVIAFLTQDTRLLKRMKIFDKQDILFDLIEQGAPETALELLKGDYQISQDELNKSLMSACQHGYTFIVPMLLQRGANVTYRDTNGNTPLLVSVQNGVTDLVQFLLTKITDVNASNFAGDSALILSVHSSGSTQITENLLKQTEINIDHQNQNCYTAIMTAAEVKNIDVLKILLDKYFNVDCITTSTLICLHFDEHKKHRHTSNIVSYYISQWTTLAETVNCRGENVHQIAERCGIGSVFQLLKEYVITKISPLELAMRANDIQSFLIFLDCNFVYAPEREIPLGKVFLQIFQTCSDKDIIHFTENEIAMIRALLEYGAYVCITSFDNTFVFDRDQADSSRFDRSGFTPKRQVDPILIAARGGCVQVLKLLLSFGADVNRNDYNNSPFHIALSHGHTKCAKLLIQHGANIDFNISIELAVDQQEPKFVRLLTGIYQNEFMKKITFDIQDILLRSVRKGNLEIIGHILDLGADINGAMGSIMFPLVESKNGEVAKFLIDRGANVNHIVNVGEIIKYTPLIEVLYGRDIYDNSVKEVIQVLLDNGASANDRSWSGKSALMVAATKEGSRSVLQLLLDHGAELSERDRDGNTALIHAASEGCSQNVLLLLQFIQDRKQILNLQNNHGLTVLMCAVWLRNPFVIKELINQGADVNIKDRNGNTALLHLLVTSNKHEDEILRSLIQAGCDVNYQNDGISPLMLAADQYLKDTMCVLLDSGAEINAISKKDKSKTALTYLLYRSYLANDYLSCLEYLLDRGASSSYLDVSSFHNMIADDHTQVVPKLLRCGFGPASIKLHSTVLTPVTFMMPSYSPLCSALCAGNNALAHFFVENLFLTHSDVSLLGHNKLMRQYLERENFKECLNIFNELSTQPMTLFNLSFVAVSTAVGTALDRENRVNELPLPQIIKKKLLFRSHDVL